MVTHVNEKTDSPARWSAALSKSRTHMADGLPWDRDTAEALLEFAACIGRLDDVLVKLNPQPCISAGHIIKRADGSFDVSGAAIIIAQGEVAYEVRHGVRGEFAR